MAGPLYEALFIFFGGRLVEIVCLLWWLKLPGLECPDELDRMNPLACFNANCTLFSIEFMEACLTKTWMRNMDAGLPFVTTKVVIKDNDADGYYYVVNPLFESIFFYSLGYAN